MQSRIHRVPLARALTVIAALATSAQAMGAALAITGQPPSSVTVGQAYFFQPTTTTARRHRLSFQISGKPVWATFSRYSGSLNGVPLAGAVGNYPNIIISASDGSSRAALPAFSIAVHAAAAANHPPSIAGAPPTAATVGLPYQFKPSATDVDGNALSFSVQNKPSWASLSLATGALTGTPTAAGSFANVILSVSDGIASTALPAFSIAVVAASPPPATGTATISWAAPSRNVDGTLLANLAGFRVIWGTSASQLTGVLQVPGAASAGASLINLASGTYYFAVKAYTTDGTESAPSPIVAKVIS